MSTYDAPRPHVPIPMSRRSSRFAVALFVLIALTLVIVSVTTVSSGSSGTSRVLPQQRDLAPSSQFRDRSASPGSAQSLRPLYPGK
jgi:hypothetical protein